MITLSGVAKRYGDVEALRSIDLDVGRGQLCALLGPNGAGKTTTISLISGLLEPDAGRLEVDGIDVRADPRAVRSLIGIAPQTLGVYPHASARENLRLFARLRDLSRRQAASEVERVAELLRLTHLLDRRARSLSGGEQRRLHTAIAMIGAPPILLLDEPTVGADIETRVALLDLLRELRRGGTTIIYTTHYLAEIEVLDPAIVVIAEGRMVASGSIDAIRAAAGNGHRLRIRLADGGADGVSVSPPAEVIERHNDGSFEMAYDPAMPPLPFALATLGSRAEAIASLEVVRPTLESAYLTLLALHQPRSPEDKG